MFEIIGNKAKGGEEIERLENAKIKVVGVGGGGGNAVNTMISSGLSGVEYIVANTDSQALTKSLAKIKVQLGKETTKGLGAGANPEVGRKAALEEYEKLSEILSGADMVFITAGMGGGTGTGAAPVIARLAKELGALTVGVVTKPFNFEGKKRSRQAESGIKALEEGVDSLITIPNQRLLQIAGEGLSLVDTFKKADEVLLNAVQGISDLINNTGLINADFADVSTVMANKGRALMGTGISTGPERALKAATEAISSPLLEDINIQGATGIIINITGDSSLTTHETNAAVTLVMEAADPDAEIIFGTVIDENMGGNVKVTVIATGLGIPQKSAEAVVSAAPAVEKKEEVKVKVEAPKVEIPVAALVRPQVVVSAPVQEVVVKPAPVQSVPVAEPVAVPVRPVVQEVSPQASQPVTNRQSSSVEEKMNNKAKSIAERLGFINFDDDFDTPSFLRNDNEETAKSNRPPEKRI